MIAVDVLMSNEISRRYAAIQFVTSEDHNPQGTVLVLGEAREARSSKPATKVSDSEQTDYNKAILCCGWSHSWSRMVGWQNEAPC